jgi:hypothetical protein
MVLWENRKCEILLIFFPPYMFTFPKFPFFPSIKDIFKKGTNRIMIPFVHLCELTVIFLLNNKSNGLILRPSGNKFIGGISPLEKI